MSDGGFAGKDEGAFAWLTLNYLLGRLGGAPQETVSAVDLGGGSVQVRGGLLKEGDGGQGGVVQEAPRGTGVLRGESGEWKRAGVRPCACSPPAEASLTHAPLAWCACSLGACVRLQEAFAMTHDQALAAPKEHVTKLHGGGKTYSVYVHR